MKAHWLNDGEQVLVTGTLDPDEAKDFLLHHAGEPDMADFIEDTPGQASRGNIIPQHPEADYRWMWYENAKGRCKGVTFG